MLNKTNNMADPKIVLSKLNPICGREIDGIIFYTVTHNRKSKEEVLILVPGTKNFLVML